MNLVAWVIIAFAIVSSLAIIFWPGKKGKGI